MQTTATQRQKPIAPPADRGISALVRVGQGFRNASRGLLRRVNLDRLMNRHNETVVASVFALICGTLGIGVMSHDTYTIHTQTIIASLGQNF